MARPVGRPRELANIFNPPKSNVQFSEGQKSKGILDDFAVRKNIDTNEGTIQNAPVNAKDIVNKEYADALVIGVGENYWVSGAAVLTPKSGSQGISGAYISGANVTSGSNPGHTHTGYADQTDFQTVSGAVVVNTAKVSYTDATQFQTISGSHLNLSGAYYTHAGLVNEHLDWTADQSPAVINAANYVDNDTTYVSSDFTHDDLTGYEANEHIDWTSDQGATNIHAGNYTDTDTTAHASFTQLDYASAGHTGFTDNTQFQTVSGAVVVNTAKVSYTDAAQYQTTSGASIAHIADNTQAHSDYLLNSGADSAVGPITITADNSSADTAYVPMVLYNTDATPPAASGFPVGTLYVQYTA